MGTSVSRAILAHLRNIFAALLAALLVFTLVPPAALAADGEGADAATPSEGSHAEEGEGAFGSEVPTSPQPPSPSSNGGSVIAASALIGKPTSFVSADVALVDDAEPVVGSFTVDGLTYALSEDGATLVTVAPAENPEGALGSEVPTSPRPPSGSSAGMLSLPGNVAYGGVDYGVVAIGAYAFYLSGITEVSLPESVASVDDRAFRSSDVARVEVDPANPNIASFDGALYSTDLISLLLIPEGRAGAILLPKTAEVVEAGKFSHCSLVDAISVEEGGAAFASWEGLLYDADATTLLRVPAGASDIAIREGCTIIAAGAMEGCAKLEAINAPASVTSISPDVFASVPTVSLPAASLVVAGDDVAPNGVEEGEGALGSEVPTSPRPPSPSSTEAAAPQLSAMVALSSGDDIVPETDPAVINVVMPEGVRATAWQDAGFLVDTGYDEGKAALSVLQSDATPAPLRGGASLQEQEASLCLPRTANLDLSMTNIVGNGGLIVVTQYTNSGMFWDENTVEVHTLDKTYAVNASGSRGSYTNNRTWKGDFSVERDGYMFAFWGDAPASQTGVASIAISASMVRTMYAIWEINVSWDLNGGTWGESSDAAIRTETSLHGAELPGPSDGRVPRREGYRFVGWSTFADDVASARDVVVVPNEHVVFFAQWERIDYNLGFEVDSEPGDEDYPGDPKPDETVNVEDGVVEVENPTRPGYVFQGWVIPNASGTEAVDQELVYEGDDGKWYVDASKLPDYATDGKVELTARWTSVISVDVPNSVTFYADTVTQGSESRDGLADRAFGQSKVQSQSQVDLRIVGLESQEVKGDGGSSLGASDVLVSKGASTPADSAWKLFSLYPSATEPTPEELQDPDRVSEAPEGGVTFGLDDVLLEGSFSSDDFTIPAGDTLSLGYRLNLEETGTSLDYGKLSALPEGGSAALANISYCFATEGHLPSATGSTSDEFYIESGGLIYGPDDIKQSASCIATYGTNSPCYDLYSSFMKSGMDPADENDAHGYVKWGDGATYNVRIIGMNYDDAVGPDGNLQGKAGLTFEFVSKLGTDYVFTSDNKNAKGWGSSVLRDNMNAGTIWGQVPGQLSARLATVRKHYQGGGTSVGTSGTSDDRLFLPSYAEMMSSPDPSWSKWWTNLVKERGDMGAPYQYYAQFDIVQNSTVIDSLVKGDNSWWHRTAYPGNSTSFTLGTTRYIVGYDTSGVGSNYRRAVVPCFCL